MVPAGVFQFAQIQQRLIDDAGGGKVLQNALQLVDGLGVFPLQPKLLGLCIGAQRVRFFLVLFDQDDQLQRIVDIILIGRGFLLHVLGDPVQTFEGRVVLAAHEIKVGRFVQSAILHHPIRFSGIQRLFVPGPGVGKVALGGQTIADPKIRVERLFPAGIFLHQRFERIQGFVDFKQVGKIDFTDLEQRIFRPGVLRRRRDQSFISLDGFIGEPLHLFGTGQTIGSPNFERRARVFIEDQIIRLLGKFEFPGLQRLFRKKVKFLTRGPGFAALRRIHPFQNLKFTQGFAILFHPQIQVCQQLSHQIFSSGGLQACFQQLCNLQRIFRFFRVVGNAVFDVPKLVRMLFQVAEIFQRRCLEIQSKHVKIGQLEHKGIVSSQFLAPQLVHLDGFVVKSVSGHGIGDIGIDRSICGVGFKQLLPDFRGLVVIALPVINIAEIGVIARIGGASYLRFDDGDELIVHVQPQHVPLDALVVKLVGMNLIEEIEVEPQGSIIFSLSLIILRKANAVVVLLLSLSHGLAAWVTEANQ